MCDCDKKAFRSVGVIGVLIVSDAVEYLFFSVEVLDAEWIGLLCLELNGR